MEANTPRTQDTLATYLERWLAKATTGGLRNPLLKMPVKRFRLLQPEDFATLSNGRNLIVGTTSDPIARNLYKNYDEKIRERGEQTGFFTLGTIEVALAGATTSGGKRAALLPVWLRRVELRKQGERIVAEPGDENAWTLNPELHGVLQPLGIDERQGPLADYGQLLLWLSSQLGNRGRVDTAISYVGCFSSQHLVIRERLSDGRWRRAFAENHAIAAKLLGARDSSGESFDAPVSDAKIEDLGLVLPIDDSQLKVVQMADAGRSMVVQGPPGTGKSQTIANLVANALWRGKRVLVVCDKRTAIRQVEERLVKCGLGPGLLNLHDEGLDKKAFLQQAAEVFPSGGSGMSRYPVSALAGLRNELNQRVLAGRAIVHPALGLERFCAQAGLIQLRERLKNAPSVDIANWQSLSHERLNRLFANLAEWESVSEVAANRDPVWNAVQWTVFRSDPNARVEVSATLEALGALLGRIVELRESAAVVGYDHAFDSLAAIDDLIALTMLVGRRPRCHATILDDAHLSLAHVAALEDAENRRSELLRAGHPVDLTAGPKSDSRSLAQTILREENAIAWTDLDARMKQHRAATDRLAAIDASYSSLAVQHGWIPQPSRSLRIAQLAQVRELLETQIAIPAAWWSQSGGAPVDGVATWRREFESLALHVANSPLPVDLPALGRVPETIWPAFEAAAEDGFNAISYCLRYRNDRRVKLALRQIFPGVRGKDAPPWLTLVLHALKLRATLIELRAASRWHFDLRGLAEANMTATSAAHTWLNGERLQRFESIQHAAALVERLRLRNDLFRVESPVWTAGWETTGSRQIREVEIALQTWHEWQPPVAEIDDVAEAKTWLGARATRISDFLGTHRNAAGDLSRSVISAWDEHVTWREKSKTLEELTRYREITTGPAESVNWDELKATVAWRDETRKRRGPRRLDLDHPAWKQTGESALTIAAGIRKGLEDLERFFRGSAEEGNVFATLADRLRVIAKGLPLLDLWCRKTEWNAKVVAWPELRPFWSRVTDGQTPAGQARPLFCYNLLRLTTPPLEPHGPELAEKLRFFAAQDEQLEQWSVGELRQRLAEVQQEAIHREPMGFAELQRLATLQRVKGTVRQLSQVHLPLLLGLKPAWLMSPISLANLMDLQRLADAGQPFDLVIFDEASQIPVTEGLLPLGFAKQTLIVGDDKQLPPTSFFTTSALEDDDQPEEMGESESLIEEFVGALPSPMLMAHYRSETPDLIGFSNREFYEGKLEMYPPVRVAGLGRRYQAVPNGVFDSGGTRVNIEEAKTAVRLVEEHVKHHGARSLGVVAMNAEQADLIESLLVNASIPVREFCADEERFFIRNLETVQGDEMDRIIVSLTYGKSDPANDFNAAVLGPLVRKGGHRRLNVALSRSRSGMTILTSMTSAMLAGSSAKSEGFACLKRLLEELETSSAQGGFGITHQRFAKRRDGISEVVHCESPFEEQVVEFLENRGYELRCQFGVQRPDGLGSFRLDIVIVDGGIPLLAVECDGAAYHRSLSARTRDRARQSQLERLGWKFHRVWSTNWWLFPDAEKEALIAAIADAQRNGAPARKPAAFGASHSVTAKPEMSPSSRGEAPPAVERPTPVPNARTGEVRQAALFDEFSEMAPKAPAASVVRPSEANSSPSRNGLVFLQDWSRLPGWPEIAVGKRVQWQHSWGKVTRVERGGKSIFFREEITGSELELSAEFIRMRSAAV